MQDNESRDGFEAPPTDRTPAHDATRMLQRTAELMWEGKSFDEAKVQSSKEWAEKSHNAPAQQPRRQESVETNSSLWQPLAFVGIVVFDLFLASRVEDASPGNGKWVVGAPIAIAGFIVLLSLVVRSSWKDSASAFAELTKAVVATLLAILAIGSIGMCATGSHTAAPELGPGAGEVPDSSGRKP